MDKVIKLQHGCGGKPTARLIQEVFYKYFDNEQLRQGYDSAYLDIPNVNLAFTTDSFIIKPHFFSGGDIGKLAVCGTANDLAVCGAKPLFMSCGMIIEEGFEVERLEAIAASMADTAARLGIRIVTGDTKVVERGNADGIYINTAGIGSIMRNYIPKQICSGDAIIVSGGIGEHGTLVALNRYNMKYSSSLQSDCAPVFPMAERLQPYFEYIKLMKDPTRGGVATTVNEIAEDAGLNALLWEDKLPIKGEIRAVCSMLGMEPLYLACEGRLLLVVDKDRAAQILDAIKEMPEGKEAAIIGVFEEAGDSMVYLENQFGSKRILPALEGDLLPRIC